MFLANIKPFLLPFALIWVIGLFLVLNIDKGDAVLFFDRNRTPLLTHTFKLLTHLGEFWGVMVAIIVLFIAKQRLGVLTLLMCWLVNGPIVQFLKRGVFTEMHRPSKWLDMLPNDLEGVELARHFSFPSGHTNLGIMIVLVLAYFIPDKRVKIGLAFLGLGIGLSRVYLFQHFLMDILAGSFLAIIISLPVIYLVTNSRLKELKFIKRI